MQIPWVYPVRIAQAILGLIVLGLTAYVVDSFRDEWAFSDTVNFMLFLGCWTALIAVPYLATASMWFRIAHHLVIPAIEIITMIFWFAGFITMGAVLPPPRACRWSTCRALQATTVFGSFEWVLFAVTCYFSIIDLRNHGNTKQHSNAHLGV
ncbi:hypothetical protein NUU61_002462 [Penicillium alfredii]|uniref:MARVEL domain-containing protein n=1 Tax=Penicillium alfredii TaxID=1506179 RepID=A0A9W9FRN1_9EURO|nr:uncharacterized protein NUU61_002462 [Penicillium alfredii]KAJ5105115.1 hypothetical protein NUU61_002462 [Penicillium alfredii]